MTDKQIITDGCDVSGCECYSEHREGYCGWHTPCEGDTCPYKLKWALQQLKAKEQECEKIKEDNATLFDKAIEARKECTDLKEQLFLLKIDYAELEKRHNDSFEQFNDLKAENEELKNFHINLVGVKECEIKELLKLKQTLAEIKEIAKKSCCLQPTSTCEEYENCKECGRTSDAETVKQILQKISEVEDGV